MVNLDRHRGTLIAILRTIYSDTLLRGAVGFKGGTAAMLFYELPRFSVDLDFDLLNASKKEEVFRRVKEILPRFGRILEAQEKQYTLFFLLSYQKGERNIKIDMSKRNLRREYIPLNYLGISMLVMRKEDMAASKLSALLTRRKFAARDMFDLWFFLKEQWEIDEDVVKEHTNMSLIDALTKAQEVVQTVQKTDLLGGLGELLDNKQKTFIKDKLQEELIFLLKLYLSNITGKSQ